MTNQERWNFIVQEYKKLYNEKEEIVDKRWRQYCQGLFGYNELFEEIKKQTSIHVGVHSHAIPDIILCVDNKDIFDIELKQYSFPFDDKFENQLISYLKLTHLSVGMIVCKEIYLYSYNYAQDIAKNVVIPFKPDCPDGIALMEILQKDNFSPESVHNFVDSKIAKNIHIKEIQEQINKELVLSLLSNHFSNSYTADEVEEAMRDYIVTVQKKGNIKMLATKPVTTSVYPSVAPGTETPVQRIEMAELIRKWCLKKQDDGALYLDLSKSSNSYFRFTTNTFDSLVPTPATGKSGWNNNHFYYYEIINKCGNIYMWIAFSRKNAPEEVLTAISKIFDYCHIVPSKENWEWKTIFKTKSITFSDISTPEKMSEYLDAMFSSVSQKVLEMVKCLS